MDIKTKNFELYKSALKKWKDILNDIENIGKKIERGCKFCFSYNGDCDKCTVDKNICYKGPYSYRRTYYKIVHKAYLRLLRSVINLNTMIIARIVENEPEKRMEHNTD